MKKQTKPRRRNARGEGERLRGEIINAAVALLTRLGPEEPFSLRAVAKEAAIAAPSVYLHFANRDALLLALLDKLFDDLIVLRAAAEEKAASTGGGPWEQFLAGSLAYVKFGIERPGHYRVLYEGRVVLRLEDPMLATFGRPIQQRSVALIKEIAKLPGATVPRVPPERLALLLWCGLHGLISLQINKPTLQWPRAVELATEMVRQMIGPSPRLRRP